MPEDSKDPGAATRSFKYTEAIIVVLVSKICIYISRENEDGRAREEKETF